MANERAVEILNRLLAAEYESIVPRLAEADPYVSLASSEDDAEIRGIGSDVKAHQRDLVQMIVKLRGAPMPPRYSTASGGVHYVRLSHLMPSVITNIRQLISIYESAAGATGHPDANLLVGAILDNYRRHLATLEKIHANPALQGSQG